MWGKILMLLLVSTTSYADDTGDAVSTVNQFSTQIITLLKGPITKILGGLVLLGAVAALLRGRHHIAIACGTAFVILLFLPMLLDHVGGAN